MPFTNEKKLADFVLVSGQQKITINLFDIDALIIKVFDDTLDSLLAKFINGNAWI